MADVVLATCTELPTGDEDGDLLVGALADQGMDAQWVPWTSWAQHGPNPDTLVVVRSTWDYTARRPEFVSWLRGLPRVANPADVVTWNTDKTYLVDLAAAGLPIVPTTFAAPGSELALPDAKEIVVKPSVGAGSRGAGRFASDNLPAARAHAAALHGDGSTVLVQPYLADVDVAGETALIYFDGRFSHAVRKSAMLAADAAHAVVDRELFVQEQISSCTPSTAELAVGDAACQVIRDRFGTDLLYARVDLLPSPDGPLLIELELSEPSLFLGRGQEDGSGDAVEPAARFAAAIAARA